MSPSRPIFGSPETEELHFRKHDRFQVEIPGLARLIEHRGIYAVTVLDISKTGLRITCPRALPSGTRLEIKCQNVKLFGCVKYSREAGNEIYLGIEVDMVDAPSSGAQPPETGEIDLLALFPSNIQRLKRP
jgi:PilZ domain